MNSASILFEPPGIHDVVAGDSFNHVAGLLGANVFYFSGGRAGIKTAGFYYGSGEYYCACRDDGVFANDGVVEDDGSDAKQYVVAYSCAVYYCVVSDGYVVADFYDGFFVECVEYGAVLYVYAVADAYRIDVATQYCVEPYAAFAAHDDVANDGGVVCKIAVFAVNGGEAPYRFNDGHDVDVRFGVCLVVRTGFPAVAQNNPTRSGVFRQPCFQP